MSKMPAIWAHKKFLQPNTTLCKVCDGLHSTEKCNKPKDSPPVCTNCKGNHPANYRGCPEHVRLQRGPIKSQPIINKIQYPQIAPVQHFTPPEQAQDINPSVGDTNKRPLYSNVVASSKNTNNEKTEDIVANNNNTLIIEMLKKMDMLISLIQPLVNSLNLLLPKVLHNE